MKNLSIYSSSKDISLNCNKKFAGDDWKNWTYDKMSRPCAKRQKVERTKNKGKKVENLQSPKKEKFPTLSIILDHLSFRPFVHKPEEFAVNLQKIIPHVFSNLIKT